MAALGSPRGKTQHLGCHSAETCPQGFDLGRIVADGGFLERVPAESIAETSAASPGWERLQEEGKGLTSPPPEVKATLHTLCFSAAKRVMLF